MKLHLPNPFDSRPALVRNPLPGFDPIYYLYWYPDVRTARLDPLRHYLLAGWKEGRDPSAGFSTSGYLAANLDVAAAGLNPLLHFVNTGFAEGRGGYLKDPRTSAPRPNHATEPMRLLTAPSPSATTSLQGFVDELSHTSVRGWALPDGSASLRADIQILVDDVLAGCAVASLYRPDLEDEKIGDAHHGFEFRFDPPLDKVAKRIVIVRRTADGLEIGRAIVCTDQ
ncbi:hypothetical protein [Methylobacterium sp. 13MFTsu3.1M2]|uniref:hypothetical protein n=1 Tax=Methylobacterium sp. 13MFTsu3.1M2 TaxID=1502776 RepID=UPI00329831B9